MVGVVPVPRSHTSRSVGSCGGQLERAKDVKIVTQTNIERTKFVEDMFGDGLRMQPMRERGVVFAWHGGKVQGLHVIGRFHPAF